MPSPRHKAETLPAIFEPLPPHLSRPERHRWTKIQFLDYVLISQDAEGLLFPDTVSVVAEEWAVLGSHPQPYTLRSRDRVLLGLGAVGPGTYRKDAVFALCRQIIRDHDKWRASAGPRIRYGGYLPGNDRSSAAEVLRQWRSYKASIRSFYAHVTLRKVAAKKGIEIDTIEKPWFDTESMTARADARYKG